MDPEPLRNELQRNLILAKALRVALLHAKHVARFPRLVWMPNLEKWGQRTLTFTESVRAAFPDECTPPGYLSLVMRVASLERIAHLSPVAKMSLESTLRLPADELHRLCVAMGMIMRDHQTLAIHAQQYGWCPASHTPTSVHDTDLLAYNLSLAKALQQVNRGPHMDDAHRAAKWLTCYPHTPLYLSLIHI